MTNHRIIVLLIGPLIAIGAWQVANRYNKSKDFCTDKQWFGDQPKRKEEYPRIHWSQYVAMSDGIELAVDIYLPGDKWKRLPHRAQDDDPQEEKGPALPTFLHLTRYNRNVAVRWPFSKISLFGEPAGPSLSTRSLKYLQTLLPNGYAVVTVDVRGTGASFGNRPADLLPREVQDYQEVLDWVLAQSWCNGRIGTGGISYDGMTGMLMAASARGKVQAVAPLFTPMDLYQELVVPGGIKSTGFLYYYSRFTRAMERGEPIQGVKVSLAFSLLSKLVLDGVFPVVEPVVGNSSPDGGIEERQKEGQNKLAQALKEHQANWNMEEVAKSLENLVMDVPMIEHDGIPYGLNDLGIQSTTFSLLHEFNVAVYIFAGYFDSGSVAGGERAFKALGGPSNPLVKFTVGPWQHGARAACSPALNTTKVCFDMYADLLRFFNCRLKGICDLFEKEDPVHYFTMGEEQWHNAETFPPLSVEWKDFYPLERSYKFDFFDSDRRKLGNIVPQNHALSYNASLITTTGEVSRWNLVFHILRQPVKYPNREQQERNALVFQSDPLKQDLTVTGSPILQLVIYLDANDVAVFVYLDEVDSAGRVHYITEGQLRGIHRAVVASNESTTIPVGIADSRPRTYKKVDAKPMSACPKGKNARLERGHGKSLCKQRLDIVLQPVSFMFKAGSRIRLAIAGSDADNFDTSFLENNQTDEWIEALGGSGCNDPESLTDFCTKLRLPVETFSV